ncbi:putative membrane-associated kinase regulator 1 [Morella rubra]|uniref:Putative membrane-associated kinase regulator 1 n=1 Tax=Morella rubra TaxID=262757 RepID=A0A6A1VN11_9ROSI|nr:putative membrane-associated kinase regulator 1 [Morella rubra]
MGRRTERNPKSQTLPPSPSHSFSSSSSSDFEFTVSISPRKCSTALCPADELFYKGQLLPLHLSPRLSMVRTLLASSSTSSSSDTTTSASRDSTGSSNDSHSSFNSDLILLGECDSSRPSSVTEDDEFKRLHNPSPLSHQIKKSKYFSLSRFSSVFRKEPKNRDPDNVSGSSVKRVSSTAKEVIRKYLKKVKPLYEKLSQKQQQQQQQQKVGGVSTTMLASSLSLSGKAERSGKDTEISGKSTTKENGGGFSHSFSGNLRYPRKRSCVSSCPSSMRSSPSHSGVLTRTGFMSTGRAGGMNYSDASSMEELQSAIQGAIAHCKNSMIQNKSMVSD